MEQPPEGIRILEDNENWLLLESVIPKKGCIEVFLISSLVVWTGICLYLPYALYRDFGSDKWTGHLVLTLVMFFAEGVLIILLCWRRYGQTMVYLTRRELIVKKVLFSWEREVECERNRIQIVRQIKDGGQVQDSRTVGGRIRTSKDTFPTWGLVVEADTNVMVLSRQNIEKSAWLGPIIAEWAGKPYIESQL